MLSLSALPTPLLALLSTIALPLARASPSDLKIEVTVPATCSHPSQNGDTIAVHYKGSLQSNGKEFDESYRRGAPFSFKLGAHRVIAGWEEGLLDMCPGEERTLIIPPELAYGASGTGPIPGGATLVFETKLVDIVGVVQESVIGEKVEETKTEEGALSIATAPPVPPPGWPDTHQEDEAEGNHGTETPTLEATPLTSSAPINPYMQEGECHLLGPFALMIQGALGGVALLTLVFKRWREETKRPWKIWFFDVSKQVMGSMLTHVLNLIMSMMGSVELLNTARHAMTKNDGRDASDATAQGGRATPNPCSFYILNLGIDTTIGIPVLYLLLRVLHHAFFYTPLANPPESIKSGHYGQPPRATWWIKQSFIYFIGLTGMKLFVWLLFAMLPWLPWVGDWALRWTEGSEALQIAFAMFIFPIIMNGIQYWIIDSFLMDKSRGNEDGGQRYERVRSESNEDEESTGVLGREDDEETITEATVNGKVDDEGANQPPLTEVNPTPIPDREDEHEHEPRKDGRRES